MIIAYVQLAFAIVAELIAAAFVTSTKGFKVVKPTIICVVGYAVSYFLFGLSLDHINLGIGYATWGACGMIFTPIVGFLFYKQRLTKIGVLSLAMIIGSVIVMNIWG